MLNSNSEQDKTSISIVWWIMLFINVFQTLHFIPDRAIAWLLKFIYVLLRFLGAYSPIIARASEIFPSTLYLRDKYSVWKNNFKRYVVCKECHTLYNYEDCIEQSGTGTRAKTKAKACSHRSFSRICGGSLLKEVASLSGNIKLYPYRVFCYKSVIDTMQGLLNRAGFADACEGTRVLYSSSKISDIYQGQLWKDFLTVNEIDFLTLPYAFGFLLNVDWFKPFQHQEYSVGVIYLAVLNLPRAIRYKKENIIIVGIMPGPSESPLTINSYLSPLVSDLLKLWTGVKLGIHGVGDHLVRAALLGVACDLPAARKTWLSKLCC